MDDAVNALSDSVQDKIRLIKLVEEKKRRERYKGYSKYFPEVGPLSWKNYPRHMLVMSGGKVYRERLFLAGNRVGKTVVGALESTYHATGQYPEWWTGHRFDHPVQIWAAGDNSKTTRNIIQYELLGDIDDMGTGTIPEDCILKDSVRKMPGVQNAIEFVKVKHVSGGSSIIEFKAYEQGRKSFQGTAKHFIWFDEEPPVDVYNEALMRTMVSNDSPLGGKILTTCTPLEGWTPFLLNLDKESDRPIYGESLDVTESISSGRSSFVVQAGMGHAPHLSEEAISDVLSAYPPSEQQARRDGIPQMGSGTIYPVSIEDLLIDPQPIMPHWRKAYALDVGWNRTAALFGAYDADRDIIYFYDEYYRERAEPEVHAASISYRYPKYGPLVGVIDPGSSGAGQRDGKKLLDIYRRLGLRLIPADNAVDAGIQAVWSYLATGRVKIFSTLVHFQEEIKMYRRDSKGRIIKEHDHLMDCLRYWILSALKVAKPDPLPAYEMVSGARDYGV